MDYDDSASEVDEAMQPPPPLAHLLEKVVERRCSHQEQNKKRDRSEPHIEDLPVAEKWQPSKTL